MKNILKKTIILIYIMIFIIGISVSAATRQNIVDEALKYLGYPYGWGGTGNAGGCSAAADDKYKGNHTHNGVYYNRCFDCSGFVQFVYKQCGYSISRTTYTQTNEKGALHITNRNEILPGDLILMNYSSKSNKYEHVGLYIGNGQYIHASGGKNAGTHWKNSTGYVKIGEFSGLNKKQIKIMRIIKDEFDLPEVPEVPEYQQPEVTAAFDLWINGEWMGPYQSTIEVEKINIIEVVDKSSELGKVVACSIKNMQTGKLEPIPFDRNKNIGTLNFTDLSYEKYVDYNKQMEIVLQVEGTTAKSKVSRIINVKNIPIELDFDIYIDGIRYSVGANKEITTWMEKINKIEFVDKSNIKGRVTGFYIMTADPETAKWEWIQNDVLYWNDECYKKYVNSNNEIVILQETTEINKYKTVKLRLISGREIGVTLCNVEYEATKENPMKEPVFLNSLKLINRTGREIAQWQILNYKTGAYGPAEMIYNEVLLKEENYKPLGNNKYVIMIKAISVNGEELVREIYIDFFTVISPINGSIVKKENQLVIKWEGDPEREYKVKMVKYFLDENGNEIEEYKITLMDKVKKGNEEVIEKIGTAGNYRIAIKDNEGQFYSIILFKAE